MRNLTRREMLRVGSAGALGAAGVALLAACGEGEVVEVVKVVTQVKQVEKIVEKEVPVTREEIVTVEAPAPAAGPVSVRFATDHTSGPRGNAMKWGMEQFSRQYPNIPVKIDVIGGDYFDSVNLQLAAGSMAEAILFEGNLFQAHYAAGFFPDITDLVGKLGFSLDDYWVLPTGWLPWEGALYQANGRLHGLPFQGGMNGIVYNVDLFESNGVDQPAEDWTWDDALEASRALTDTDDDQYGIWAPTSDQFGWGPMVWSNGVEYWFNEQGESQFDSTGAIEALTWAHGTMHTEGVAFTQEVQQRVAGEFGDPFSAGKVGIWPGGRVYSTGFGIPRIKDRFTWSVGPMYVSPKTGHTRHGWNDQPHIVTIAAERLGNLEQTVQLVTYLAGPEYQTRVGIDRGHFPVFKTVADSPEQLAAPPEGMHWLKTYATTPEPRTPGYFPYWDEFRGAHGVWQSKLWVNEVGPEEAAVNMARDTNAVISSYGDWKPVPA